MHCPKCGTPNEPKDRYCASCGATLRTAEAERKPGSKVAGLSRLVGNDRRTRIVTGLTVLAILVAIAGFISISSDEASIPRDGYTLSAERMCLNAKRQIVGAANDNRGQFARQLVPIVVRWREQMGELAPPPDRRDEVAALDDALREMEIDAAVLARRSTAGGSRAIVLAHARRAEAASAEVESAIDSLGLLKCAAARIEFRPSG